MYVHSMVLIKAKEPRLHYYFPIAGRNQMDSYPAEVHQNKVKN